MRKFLYGAAVNGIQGYIFKTDRLVEIAGASVLVKQVCEDRFAELLKIAPEDLRHQKGLLLSAAGNIKYLFTEDQLDDLKRIVLEFPKRVVEFAPGITLSQAVVPIDEELTGKHLRQLEENLKTQRNKGGSVVEFARQIQTRSRQTGNPAIELVIEKRDGKNVERYLDKEVKSKITACKWEDINSDKNIWKSFYGSTVGKNNQPYDLKDICSTKSKDYSWIAVIHADGNGLGSLLMKTSDKLGEDFAQFLPQFSRLLDEATKEAATSAYRFVHKLDNKMEPARPVIIGGDDLTIIIRADLALEFTKHYLSEFERLTKEKMAPLCATFPDKELDKLLTNGLTACAGIAIMKYNYPFHYGVSLAEDLCTQAKKVQQDPLKKSSLLFHKVLSSFVEDFKELKDRELTICNPKGEKFSLLYGPYYLQPADSYQRSIEKLISDIQKVQENNALKSGLRQWLAALGDSRRQANIIQKRIEDKYLVKRKIQFFHELHPTDLMEASHVTPVADWLTLISIN